MLVYSSFVHECWTVKYTDGKEFWNAHLPQERQVHNLEDKGDILVTNNDPTLSETSLQINDNPVSFVYKDRGTQDIGRFLC
jgi:hypothetical protein